MPEICRHVPNANSATVWTRGSSDVSPSRKIGCGDSPCELAKLALKTAVVAALIRKVEVGPGADCVQSCALLLRRFQPKVVAELAQSFLETRAPPSDSSSSLSDHFHPPLLA